MDDEREEEGALEPHEVEGLDPRPLQCHGVRGGGEEPGEEGVGLEEEEGGERVGGAGREEGQEAGVPDCGGPEGEMRCVFFVVVSCVCS